MKSIPKILIWLLAILFLIQVLQFIFPVINVKPLKGVVFEEEKPAVTWNNWANGNLQSYINNYVDFNFGFRPDFIRLYNQIQYSAFDAIHNDGIIIGKNEYLFGTDYLKEYYGEDYLGADSIQAQINKLQYIREYLKQYNTELLVVLAPGKTYFYPEFLPDQSRKSADKTNYYEFKDQLNQAQIPVFDVNKWFIDIKDTTKAPLFTQTGIHWSVYGARWVADSLIKKSSAILNKPMNQIHINNYDFSFDFQYSDNDLADLLNLFGNISDYPAAYPNFTRDDSIPKNERPNLIVISDSFFWLLFDGVLGNAYGSIDYYYYYSSIFSENYNEGTTVGNICVPCELRKTDLLIIMATTPSLKNFGYSFIDDFYLEIRPDYKQALDSLTSTYITVIKSDENWLNMVKQKAIKNNLGVDSMIFIDARYMAKLKLEEQLKSKDIQ